MIASVDSANVGAAFLTQAETMELPKTVTTTTQAPTSNLLPIATQTPTSSITDTLNNLLTTLQSIITAIRTLFNGSNSLNLGNTNTAPLGNSATGRFDFLRPVDEEPHTVLAAPSGKTSSDTSAGSSAETKDTAPVAGGSKKTSKTGQKKISKGTQLKNSNGEFLWKPKSEKDGKLAILLPKNLKEKVKDVQILSPDGTKVLGKGKYAGIGNGDREHFRFSKAGTGYADGAIVVITLEDGSKRYVTIKETSERTTR
jgi:hypothetical protein